MEFDNNGNLVPYKAHIITFDECELVFGFNDDRKFLLSKLFLFANDLKNVLTDEILIWIDGSFVTQKVNPKDIDVVVFINFQHFKSKKNELTALKEAGICRFVLREGLSRKSSRLSTDRI